MGKKLAEKIRIGDRLIGPGEPCYIIAEIGSNFDGNLDRAKKLIDLAKGCGADAVKFQCFTADKIVSKEGFEGLKSGFQAKWKKPVVEVYKDAEFPREWHEDLFKYAHKAGLHFFSAPYDFEAVEILDKLGVPVFKVGSGDITWLDIVECIAKKGKPVILATGASTIGEVGEAIETISNSGNNEIILLQCVTNYPSSFGSAHIRAMVEMGRKFDVLIGYSDHTPGSIVPLGSVALGACCIEKHFTDDKTRLGPDHPHAMDPTDFKKMVDEIRILEAAMGDPEKRLYEEEKETVILQRRCLRAAEKIVNGTVIKKDMIDVLRPAPTGALYPKYLSSLVGKKAKRDLNKGEPFTKEDIL